MKKMIFLFLGLTGILAGCSQNAETTLEFSNPIDLLRQNEVIQFNINDFEAMTGSFPSGKLPLFLLGKDTLTAQFINYKGNKLPEEILLEISLAAKETKKVTVKWIADTLYPVFPPKTGIHFGRHEDPATDIIEETRLQTVKTEETSLVFQMEGPTWENDKVGFRNYFDLRNGMDIYGKTTDKIVLENVGLREKINYTQPFNFEKSYHELSDWGMDILKVGNSLGAGAIALDINDSLYRIGDNGNGMYEKVYEGPLRSEFRFSFPDWKANDKIHKITQYVSITSGQYCYKSTLFLDENKDDASFVTGIVNKHSDTLYVLNTGENHEACFTHSIQAEDTSYLGMAIMTDRKSFMLSGKTKDEGPGITETYFVKLKTEAYTPVSYRFYAFWERTDPSFRDPEVIRDVLNKDALKFENPIIIKGKQ